MSNSCVVNLYESLNAFHKKVRPAGTYSQQLLLKSNSLLNTVVIEAITGTATLRISETFNGITHVVDEVAYTAIGLFQFKSNCFHNKVRVELITTGSTNISYFVMARSDSTVTLTGDFGTGTTKQFNGTATTTAASIPAIADKTISEVLVRSVLTNPTARKLLASFDGGLTFLTLNRSEGVIWSPNAQKQVVVKSDSSTTDYEVVINFEVN